jgi:hypothetical protein
VDDIPAVKHPNPAPITSLLPDDADALALTFARSGGSLGPELLELADYGGATERVRQAVSQAPRPAFTLLTVF